ncbi:E3 ubiquitin-protein ligase RNF138 isoform X2 [Tiliqua scincoides]|uniref:E3 ubiquitin-protein ligase RNF138 isoform X2 n=1 Tax=Tiliqua scincoides TaxID=71010 RepID=UPI00346296FC
MSEEPATVCFDEDDYYCPVCQDVFRTPVRISICQHVFRSDTSTSEIGETYVCSSLSSGHTTFKCPLCQESNFTRQLLLDHCNDRHLNQTEPAICPLCVSLPWGNPNQTTRNFVDHLNQLHQFDYGDFMNLQLDEETQLQNAVVESCQVNL